MEICIDVQAAIAQRAGVGRYTQLLTEHLDRLAHPHHLRLFFFDFRNRGLPFPVQHARAQAIRWCPGRIAQKAWKTLGWPPFDTFSGRADLFHFPNFIIPPLRRGKAVVTIHDLSFQRHPEFAEARNLAYLRTHIAPTARRADHILTISKFSAAEICDCLKIPANRVTAIPLGISPDFARPTDDAIRAARNALGLDRPYLLTVGTLEPRKNLPLLIDTFERLDKFDGQLVIAGRRGWKYEPILERIQRSPRAAAIRVLESVSDTDLPALYAGAELFAIPSHYEGFGFPPLEAMACGTPVLSSSGGSLPEVLGDGAHVLPTFDPEAWTHEAARLLTDTALRATLITRGRAQAARYRWEHTARETLKVYESLAA